MRSRRVLGWRPPHRRGEEQLGITNQPCERYFRNFERDYRPQLRSWMEGKLRDNLFYWDTNKDGKLSAADMMPIVSRNSARSASVRPPSVSSSR